MVLERAGGSKRVSWPYGPSAISASISASNDRQATTQPSVGTAQPDVGTAQPGAQPGSRTAQPSVETTRLGVGTAQPGVGTAQPDGGLSTLTDRPQGLSSHSYVTKAPFPRYCRKRAFSDSSSNGHSEDSDPNDWQHLFTAELDHRLCNIARQMSESSTKSR